MAKKNGKHADVAAADSSEPVVAEAVEAGAETPAVVRNALGLVIVGPVELDPQEHLWFEAVGDALGGGLLHGRGVARRHQ